jgi:hypothetical protein
MSARSEHGGGAARYEASDARAKPLLVFGAALLGLVLVALGVCAWIVARRSAAFETRQRAHPMDAFRPIPTAPLLQPSPSVDMQAQRARERRLLATYGWVDPAEGRVRVPIERAMELVLEEGLPARASAEDAR